LAILEIVFAIHFTLKNKSGINVGLGTFTVILNGLAFYMMIVMRLGAWPTIIPHLLIILSTLILIGMYLVTRKRIQKERTKIHKNKTRHANNT